MPRSISFSHTEQQFLDGSKTVTRRLGWSSLEAGVRLRAVRKAMGLKKGEKPHVLGDIEVVSVRRERLDAITTNDCVLEGFPQMTPREFVDFFCRSMRCEPETLVTRIEFKRVASAPDELV